MRQMSNQRYVSPYFEAVVHTAVEEKEQAFERLIRGAQDRTFLMIYLKIDPRFKSLRADDRFKNLLNAIGLA
jgi:hypothetical protein